MGHSQSGRSIRFVFNAAAQSRFQRVCLWKDFTNTYEVSVLLRPLVDSQNCDCVYCVVSIHASLHLLLQVTGWSVRWSQREETSVVWFWRGWIAWLMCTGHIPGSRVTPCLPWGRQESKPLQNFLLQEAINFKHQLIIWGVIANQIDPSFWLKCTLSLFMPNKRPLSFLPPRLSFATPHPPFFFWLHSSHNRDGRTFPVAGGETEIQQERSKQDNNLHRFMCDSACTVLWSASWQTHKPAPSQLPPEYSGCL